MKKIFKRLFSDVLFRNSVYLMLSTGTMSAFGFLFWLLVAHLYSPAEIGVASSLISATNFIKYFSLLGFDSTFIRFLAKAKRQSEHINTGLILVAAAGIFASGSFVMLAPHFSHRLDLLHTPAIALSFVLLATAATLNLLTDSVFVAYRSAGYNLLVDGGIGSAVQLILPIALTSLGAYGIYTAQGVASCVGISCSVWLLMRKFGYRPAAKVDRRVMGEVQHYSSRNYLASLLNTLPIIAVPIIILNKLGAVPAGYYYLAFMMANLLYTVAYAVAQSLFAEGSYGERELLALAKRAGLFSAAIIVPAAVLFVALGPFILNIFGKTYGQNSTEVLFYLALAAPFMAASAIGSILMRILKHMKILVAINAVYVLTICGLTLWWAPRGLAWVAGSWLAGQAVTALLIYVAFAGEYIRGSSRVPRMLPG